MDADGAAFVQPLGGVPAEPNLVEALPGTVTTNLAKSPDAADRMIGTVFYQRVPCHFAIDIEFLPGEWRVVDCGYVDKVKNYVVKRQSGDVKFTSTVSKKVLRKMLGAERANVVRLQAAMRGFFARRRLKRE
eukprot:2018524-Prymnesium_polylepis.3